MDHGDEPFPDRQQEKYVRGFSAALMHRSFNLFYCPQNVPVTQRSLSLEHYLEDENKRDYSLYAEVDH